MLLSFVVLRWFPSIRMSSYLHLVTNNSLYRVFRTVGLQLNSEGKICQKHINRAFCNIPRSRSLRATAKDWALLDVDLIDLQG